MSQKEAILQTLYKFVAQRSGLEFANYGDVTSYRAEQRSITKDRHHAEALLGYVARRDSITAEDILKASEGAFSGRLQITADGEKVRIDYTTGQYFPTEYRRAVCAVCASAIWDSLRANMPEGELMHNSETGETHRRIKGMRQGDWLRQQARRELGASLARRWFN